ncbi:hypothetical protein A2U01_0059694, partial [Trifolium medium]|nr:hypothetical protein [Trifolium medium]
VLRAARPTVKSPTSSPTSGKLQSNLHKHVSHLLIQTPEHLLGEVSISLLVGQSRSSLVLLSSQRFLHA